VFTNFDTVPAFDGQTDRQANTAPMPVSRSSIAERYKNKALDVT